MSDATIQFLRMQNAIQPAYSPSLADDLQAMKEGRHPSDPERAIAGGYVEWAGAGIKLTPSGERALRYLAINNG